MNLSLEINKGMVNEELVRKIKLAFEERFEGKPVLVRAPGRVNIIGEHTDYNHGFVLPGAIDKAMYIAISPREDNSINLYSLAFENGFETTVDQLKPSDKGWPNYILGVADQLIEMGYHLKGFDLAFDGDVPIGSGLSSSAALESATVIALNEIFNLGVHKSAMPQIAQKAEHKFAGVKVGIMDMFASLNGKADHLIQLDCDSLEFKYIPFLLEHYSIVLLNTNVKHNLGDTEYNTRREQCEQGVSWVKERYPSVKSLRDVSMEMLEEPVRPKDELIFKRCKYVVEENQRLLEGCRDLENDDLKALGEKMFRTHDGLSHEYEVSCAELDFLVDAVRGNPKVPGARMMGGGFGGCTINIVEKSYIQELIDKISPLYHRKMGKPLTAYVASIDDGASVISNV